MHDDAGQFKLLTVLSVPCIPLHNNASELQERVNNASLHSRSVCGARTMNILTTLVQASKTLGVSTTAGFATESVADLSSHPRLKPLKMPLLAVEKTPKVELKLLRS